MKYLIGKNYILHILIEYLITWHYNTRSSIQYIYIEIIYIYILHTYTYTCIHTHKIICYKYFWIQLPITPTVKNHVQHQELVCYQATQHTSTHGRNPEFAISIIYNIPIDLFQPRNSLPWWHAVQQSSSCYKA